MWLAAQRVTDDRRLRSRQRSETHMALPRFFNCSGCAVFEGAQGMQDNVPVEDVRIWKQICGAMFCFYSTDHALRMC